MGFRPRRSIVANALLTEKHAPKFQQRHYEEAAQCIWRIGGILNDELHPNDSNIAINAIIAQFSAMFAMDNPKFKPDMFDKASRLIPRASG